MKKGLMFSFIMVFLTVTVLSLVEMQRAMVSYKTEQVYTERRINDMNRMYESIVRDVNKALEIITKRAISVCIGHVVTEGKGLDDAQLRLKELVWNGTLNETSESLMEWSTIPDWIKKLEIIGDLKGYYIDLTIKDFDIKPHDSWNLIIEGKIYIDISDQRGIANLSRSERIGKLVSLEGFEDPLYPLNTLGRATNTITKTPYGGNFTFLLAGENGCNNKVEVDGETWCMDNLEDHVKNSYYFQSTNGGSFLDRLEGKLEVQEKYDGQTDNVIGLESFVDKNYLWSLYVPGTEGKIENNQTNIDYLYFSDITKKGDGVRGLDSTFRVDSEHQEIYNIFSGLLIQ